VGKAQEPKMFINNCTFCHSLLLVIEGANLILELRHRKKVPTDILPTSYNMKLNVETTITTIT
jgi:hypothetical protein